MRDAAVDPRPGDFCAPQRRDLIAGGDHPHGPNVVSPEVGSPYYEAQVAALRAQTAGGSS